MESEFPCGPTPTRSQEWGLTWQQPGFGRHHLLGPSPLWFHCPFCLPIRETDSASSILLAMQDTRGCGHCPSLWPSHPPNSLVSQGLPARVPVVIPHHQTPPPPCLPWAPDVIFLEVCTQNMPEQAGVGKESGRGSEAWLPEAWEEKRALLGEASAPRA